MSVLTKISNKINDCTKFIGFILMVIMTVIIVLQVFYRYILGSSLSWSEELARYLFIWVVMLGAAYGVKESFHVAVSIVIDRLPSKVRTIVDILFSAMLGLVGIVMVKYGYMLAQTVAIQLSPATRISMFWVYISVPVSGLLIIVHILSRMEEDIRILKKVDERMNTGGNNISN